MKWYSKLYISESIEKKFKKIKWKINHNKRVHDIYIISLPSNSSNILDMIPAKDIRKKFYPKDNLKIIGLSKGYDEGIQLISKIITETYVYTKTVDVMAYLKTKEREDE